jgi:multisubunit Na+/H+ antiporter MnhC subunit
MIFAWVFVAVLYIIAALLLIFKLVKNETLDSITTVIVGLLIVIGSNYLFYRLVFKKKAHQKATTSETKKEPETKDPTPEAVILPKIVHEEPVIEPTEHHETIVSDHKKEELEATTSSPLDETSENKD